MTMNSASTEDLADLFGVTDRTVRDLAKKGVLVKIARGRFDLAGSVRGYVSHLREQAAGRMGSDESLDPVAEGALLKRSQRELNELKKAEIEGRVVPADVIGSVWSRVANAVRSSVMALPGRAQASLPHLTAHDAGVIETLCRDALENAGATMTAPDIGRAAEDQDDLDADLDEDD